MHGTVDDTDSASQSLALVGERRLVIVEQDLALLCGRSDEASDLFQGEPRVLRASHRCGATEVLGAIASVPKGISHRVQNPLILPVP